MDVEDHALEQVIVSFNVVTIKLRLQHAECLVDVSVSASKFLVVVRTRSLLGFRLQEILLCH